MHVVDFVRVDTSGGLAVEKQIMEVFGALHLEAVTAARVVQRLDGERVGLRHLVLVHRQRH